MDVNKVTIIGILKRTPKSTRLENGDAATAMTLRIGEQAFAVLSFGKLAEIVRDYVHRGSRIYVEGALRTRRGRVEIVAENVILLGHRSRREVPLKPPE